MLAVNGYILLENFFTEEEAEQVVAWADGFDNIPETPGKWMIYFENGPSGPDGSDGPRELKSRIENFLQFNTEFCEFIQRRVQPVVEDMIGDKVILFKDKMNWKRAGGKGFHAHQDHPAWDDFPPKIYYSAALFADYATVANGCLQFAKGRHHEGIFDHNKEGHGGITREGEFDWQHVQAGPRDLLIFNSFAPHRSAENTTDTSRRIFYLTYNRAVEGDHHQAYLDRKRELFPPPAERIAGTTYNTEGNKFNLGNPMK